MHGDGAQTELLDLVGDERAVDTAADANRAVVALAGAVAPDLVDDRTQLTFAVGAGSNRPRNKAIVKVTVIADTVLVKNDLRIRGVHDAAHAQPRIRQRAEDRRGAEGESAHDALPGSAAFSSAA